MHHKAVGLYIEMVRNFVVGHALRVDAYIERRGVRSGTRQRRSTARVAYCERAALGRVLGYDFERLYTFAHYLHRRLYSFKQRRLHDISAHWVVLRYAIGFAQRLECLGVGIY